MKTGNLRLLSILLAAAAMLPCLTACGQTAVSPAADTSSAASVVTEEAETAEEKPKTALPDTDWGGKDFAVLGRWHDTYEQFRNFEIVSEKEDGEVINDAIFRRNSSLSEQYNVTFSQFLTAEPHTEIQKLSLAGDDQYECVYLVMSNMPTMVTNNFFTDLNDLPYIDLSMPWWNQTTSECLSIHHKLYFTTSDWSLSDKQRTYLMAYNKQMVQDYGLDDPNVLVWDGQWTIDAMSREMKIVAKDVDGDGVSTDQDQYGLVMDSYYTFQIFCSAAANFIAGRDEDDWPTIAMNTERLQKTIDMLMPVLNDTTLSVYCNDYQGKVDYDYWSVAGKVFKDGRSLFINSFTHGLKGFSAECRDDYGVLCFPKLDEAQDVYYTSSNSINGLVFGVPTVCGDPDFSGFMLEALSWASTDTSLYAYYEVSCKTKYTYDEDSARMLDMMFENVIYDLGVIYNWGSLCSILTGDIPKSKSNVFASSYASKETAALNALAKTIDELSALG